MTKRQVNDCGSNFINLQIVKMIWSGCNTFILTCFRVFKSLKVTVLSLSVSKSTVIANGIPHSSVLAYLLPIDWPESSTLDVTPALVKIDSIFKLHRQYTYWYPWSLHSFLHCPSKARLKSLMVQSKVGIRRRFLLRYLVLFWNNVRRCNKRFYQYRKMVQWQMEYTSLQSKSYLELQIKWNLC